MNHKIAILSDVHGNATALEAVIADAKNQGASEYWLLGDIFLPGPGANDLVALLKDLPITASVRGNWDDRVLEALDGQYGLEDPQEVQLLRMTQYLMERMDPATIVWLRSLPLVVREKNAELAKLAYGSNFEQVSSAPVTIALFTDTDLAKRARKIARVGGANNFSEEQLQYFMKNLPAEFARYNEQQVSDYLALNAGLVAMNLVLALTDQGIGSNIILGFDKSKVNEVLEIEDRFRPELLITVGYTDDKLEPSYRLPVDEIIEKR